MKDIIIKHPADFEFSLAFAQKHNNLVNKDPGKFTWDSLSVQALLDKIKEQQDIIDNQKVALNKIANWELPETGKFWDREEKEPMSYEACFGSNGARDYIRKVAIEALIK